LKGSLDKGRQFKTDQAAEQIANILSLEAATTGVPLSEVAKDWQRVVEQSPIVAKPKDLIKDGWGTEFTVQVSGSGADETIQVTSPHTKKKSDSF
jgi:hypothetical protein